MTSQIRSFGMSQMTIGSCSDFHSKVLGFITAATAHRKQSAGLHHSSRNTCLHR